MVFVTRMLTLALQLAGARGGEAAFPWVALRISLYKVLVLISPYILAGCGVFFL